jgi:hypothetical protein
MRGAAAKNTACSVEGNEYDGILSCISSRVLVSLEGGLEQPAYASLELSTFHGCIDGAAELGRTYCCLEGCSAPFANKGERLEQDTWLDWRAALKPSKNG